MSIVVESEGLLELDLIQNISNIFPGLAHDPKVKSIFNADLDTINQNLPIIIERIPFSISSYNDDLNKMRRYRDMQEQKIHDKIQSRKPIDFLNEVTKYNPDIGRAITESESMCEALARIIRESNDRIQNFKRTYSYQDDEYQETTSPEDLSRNRQEDETEDKKYYSESDTLSFFDLGELKRVHSDIGLDIEQITGDEDSSEQKSKKIVVFGSSGKYVFGFDKVENLMDPVINEDEFTHDYGRDILKEIHVNHDYNYNSYKFLNFS